jgi:type II secretory pathway predicted ATPase ExeA/Mrp family chromosome partitioning ATPase
MLLFVALGSLRQSAVAVFLFETVCSPLDLLRSLLTALGVNDATANIARLESRLQEALIGQARLRKRFVVVMDEAQNLDHSVSDLIRTLSNFETPQQKLLQIILAGQPPLAEEIASPGLEQLRQRISIFAHLKPFSREETQLYIEHRLRVAGYTLKAPLFTRDALALIAGSSGGVPPHHQQPVLQRLIVGIRTQEASHRRGDHQRSHRRPGDSPDRPVEKENPSRPPAPRIPNVRAVHRSLRHAMSRHYQLMQELERDRAFFSTRFHEPAFSLPGDQQNDPTDHRAPSELTLLLVQRLFLKRTPLPRMVVFAAVDHGNGCSQIAALVAKTLTEMATGPVCLFHPNFHSPALPRILGATNYRGLSDALREPGNITSFAKPVWKQGLSLLSSGPTSADAANLLITERMTARSADLRKAFDFVIVDAPPLANYPEAIALGKLSDGVVLVIEAGSTRRKTARAAVENLRASGVEILAVILNKQK